MIAPAAPRGQEHTSDAPPPQNLTHPTHHTPPYTQARKRAQRFGMEYVAPDRAAFFEKSELKRAALVRRDEGALGWVGVRLLAGWLAGWLAVWDSFIHPSAD